MLVLKLPGHRFIENIHWCTAQKCASVLAPWTQNLNKICYCGIFTRSCVSRGSSTYIVSSLSFIESTSSWKSLKCPNGYSYQSGWIMQLVTHSAYSHISLKVWLCNIGEFDSKTVWRKLVLVIFHCMIMVKLCNCLVIIISNKQQKTKFCQHPITKYCKISFFWSVLISNSDERHLMSLQKLYNTLTNSVCFFASPKGSN